MNAVKELDEVFLVLGANADAIVQAVPTGRARVVAAAGWADGQSAALRAGVAAAVDAWADAVVITLGDQPLVTSEAIRRVVAVRRPAAYDAAVATYGDVHAHPVLFERGQFLAIGDLRGDAGGRSLLQNRDRVALVACDDAGSPEDVDTPEDLRRLAGR